MPKYGNTAVARNRVKRRLKDILRSEVLPRLDEAGAARDMLVRARREAYDASHSELAAELTRWTEARWHGSSSH